VTRSWRDYVIGEVFAERLWRPGTYEEVSLGASGTVSEARASIGSYLVFIIAEGDIWRRDRRTPDPASFNRPPDASLRWPFHVSFAGRKPWPAPATAGTQDSEGGTLKFARLGAVAGLS
jgi:hypothetical protein